MDGREKNDGRAVNDQRLDTLQFHRVDLEDTAFCLTGFLEARDCRESSYNNSITMIHLEIRREDVFNPRGIITFLVHKTKSII